jgi:23S rRNA (cytosine1962-C5)-methyltransferase
VVDARRQESGFYRALHGIGQMGIPRFHLDRYGPLWLATFSGTPGAEERNFKGLASLLEKSAPGVVFRWKDETKKGHTVAHVAAGECPKHLVVEHAGYRFEVHPLDPIDPGAYPDSEPLREAIRGEARDKRVLNLFAFTCLNGVVARLAGARSVLNVDLARSHLERGKKNYELNALSVDDRDFVADDVLRWAAKAPRARFDLVVVDPPPFVRRGKGRVPSEEALETLLAAVLPLAAPGGTIHFLQCTARITEEELRERVRAACPGMHVSVRAPKLDDLDANELAPTFKDAVIRVR